MVPGARTIKRNNQPRSSSAAQSLLPGAESWKGPKGSRFPHLKEAAPRTGFVEEAQYHRLCKNARELWLRSLLATAYTFGFRKSELLNLRVRQVDLLNRTIRLNAGETKSGDGRTVKLTSDVFFLLQACISGKK